ncbi:MAG TPA: MBL fold metallo-hydrolase [Longimicrobium sp.]|jgi:glyoxylase-like metal-dependent hydrolase (beta-lactamase superfamily II)
MLFEESPGVWRVDLDWMGLPGQMAAYLVDAGDAFAVVESGPGSTLPRLLDAVRALGREPADVTHVLVTHVHLDHAGAAGALLGQAPRARLYAHPLAAKHLLDPSRLLDSARRIYGALMDRLWGEMLPVPADRLVILQDGDEVRIGRRVLRAIDTPGHARHHHAFHDSDSGLLFSGDVGGIRLGGGLSYVSVPTPPPDVDLEAWRASIARLRPLRPTRILPTHFGGNDDVEWHLDDLDARIARLAEWAPGQAAAAADLPGFTAALRERGSAEILAATGSEDAARAYEQAVPYEMMAAGLLRWLTVRAR